MRIGLFASDIDGTILPYGQKEPSPRTKAAVKRCAESGVPFVIASGRWFASARQVMRLLGQSGGYLVIANGGAVCRPDGTRLREWRMTREQAERIHEISLKYRLMRISFLPDTLYRTGSEVMNRVFPERVDHEGGYTEYHTDAETFTREALDRPYKLDFHTTDAETLRRLRGDLEAEGFIVASSWPTNVEITVPGTGKGVAVRWLAEQLGVDPADVMAFGDNLNDLDLMENVGWPVAVENAADELKRKTRIVCGACDDDGVARMIERVLEGEMP